MGIEVFLSARVRLPAHGLAGWVCSRWLAGGRWVRGPGRWPARLRWAARGMPAAAPVRDAAAGIHPQSVRPVWRAWVPTAITLAPVMAQGPGETGIAIRASRRAMRAARTAATVVAAIVAARLTPKPGGNLTAGEVPFRPVGSVP